MLRRRLRVAEGAHARRGRRRRPRRCPPSGSGRCHAGRDARRRTPGPPPPRPPAARSGSAAGGSAARPNARVTSPPAPFRSREHNEHKRDGSHSWVGAFEEPVPLPPRWGTDAGGTMAHQPSPDTRSKPRTDRTHYLYVAVIVAVLLGIVVGFVAPDFAVKLKPLGEAFVNLIKMMIVTGHLLHPRAGGRVRAQRRQRRQGRRPGPGLLPGDVDLRPGDRPGRRQHPAPGPGPQPHRRRGGGRAGAGRRGVLDHGVPAGHHPDHPVLVGDRGRGAADAAGGAAGRVRAAGDGPLRRADPARHRPPPAAGVPGAGDDHVGGPGRRVRRHRRRGGRDRARRPQEPRRDHGRLLHHLRDLRVRDPRRPAQDHHRGQHLRAAALPRPRVPADPLDVVLGVGAAAADRQDGARRRRPDHRRRGRAHGLLVQPRRHGDLPDHGVAVHRRGAR